MQTIFHCVRESAFSYKMIFLPIKDYWFMAAYFFVALVAPFINNCIRSFSSRERWSLIIVLILINVFYGFIFDLSGVGNGYTAIQGVFMYVLGCVFSHEKKILSTYISKNGIWLGIYVLMSVSVSVIAWVFCTTSHYEYAWRAFAYNNPIICMGAVALCMFFVNMKKQNKVIKHIAMLSKYSLAIYLITDCFVIKKEIFSPILKFQTFPPPISCVVFYSICLCLMCICVDFVRKVLFDLVERFFCWISTLITNKG